MKKNIEHTTKGKCYVYTLFFITRYEVYVVFIFSPCHSDCIFRNANLRVLCVCELTHKHSWATHFVWIMLMFMLCAITAKINCIQMPVSHQRYAWILLFRSPSLSLYLSYPLRADGKALLHMPYACATFCMDIYIYIIVIFECGVGMCMIAFIVNALECIYALQ